MFFSEKVKRAAWPFGLVMVLCLGAQPAVSQESISKELENIQRRYAETAEFSLSMLYKWYPNESSATPETILEGYLIRHGDFNYMRIGPVESYSGKDGALVANAESRRIRLYPKPQLPQQTTQINDIQPGFSMLPTFDELEPYGYFEYGGTQARLVLGMDQTETRVRLIYDPQTYQIAEVHYLLAANPTDPDDGTKPKIVVQYLREAFELEKSQKISLANFVYASGNTYFPNAKYKGFELSNLSE